MQAEFRRAELEWEEWAVALSRVGEVLDPGGETGQDQTPAESTSTAEAARPRSQMPM